MHTSTRHIKHDFHHNKLMFIDLHVVSHETVIPKCFSFTIIFYSLLTTLGIDKTQDGMG